MENSKTTKILKSLADDMRLSIVRKLAIDDKEFASSEIVTDCATFLKLSQPTMSHHFTRLVEADVLIERKVGTEKYYRINKELLETIGINPTKL